MKGWVGGEGDRRWAKMCFRVGKRRGEEGFSEQGPRGQSCKTIPAPFRAKCKCRFSLVLLTDKL